MNKPLPKPAPSDKENREAPVLVLPEKPPKPKPPTPEAEVPHTVCGQLHRVELYGARYLPCIFLQTVSNDERCDTVTHSVRLLEQVREIMCMVGIASLLPTAIRTPIGGGHMYFSTLDYSTFVCM